MSKEYRTYFGYQFYKQKDGYWTPTKSGIPQAHRWVWINHNGEIPSEMIIHHIDGNKDNNEIKNLMMLSRADHMKEHCKDENEREIRRKRMNDIRPLVHEWLRSDKGRKKQSEDAKEGWKTRKSVQYICRGCNKEKITYQAKSDFCSDACRNRWKRHNKPNPIEIICPICQNAFTKDKSDPKKICSRSCSGKMAKS